MPFLFLSGYDIAFFSHFYRQFFRYGAPKSEQLGSDAHGVESKHTRGTLACFGGFFTRTASLFFGVDGHTLYIDIS